MKTSLSLGLMFAALGTLAACSSDEEGVARNPPVTAAGAGGTAGTGNESAGGTGTTTPGGGTGGTGSGPASAFRQGPALTITATPTGANVIDEDGDSAISGGVILAQSTMTVAATTSHRDGALCVSGTTATVLNDDYTTYWGAELSMDLLLVPEEGTAAPAADAGADAGGGGTLVRAPWPIGEVVGFSFKVEGNGAGGAGIPAPNEFRFKALPEGSDPSLDTYCSQPGPTSGETVEVPFSDITFECWAPGNPSLADPMINTVPMSGAPATQRANPGRLQTISWQIAATTSADIPFDFCVSDIRPLYAQ